MPEAVGQILDRERALARVGGDAELLRELAALFVEEYPRMLGEIQSGLDQGDAHAVERAAHGLKGSVASLGGIHAMEMARYVEMLGRAQRLTEVRQTMHSLELALVALRVELCSI